ncbi:hypothetical protein N8745_04315 [Candidatus Pelagibacter sp.]|nr:hypothetical protein [Candidatus Pelagibacter sp.]
MKKKIPVFFLSLSIFIFLYIFLKSEIIWSGNKRDYYLFYYIISFILIGFSSVTFLINKEINQILLISFFTILASFYSVEIYLNLKTISKKNPNLDNKIKIFEANNTADYDKRTKFQIYKDLKTKDKNISVALYPRNFLHKKNDNIFFLSGIKNSETIVCNENGYYSVDKSDRYGFNNLDHLWDKEEIDILIIGDSYAYGECVNRKDNFASKLSKYGENISVINLGYGGNGPLIEYATFKEFAPKNYKKLIWFYFEGNDLNDLSKELSNKILLKYLTDDNFTQNLKFKSDLTEKELKNRLKEFEKEETIAIENIKKIDFLKLVKLFKVRRLFIKDKTKAPLDYLEKILKKTQLLKEQDSDLFLVYIPSTKRYFSNLSYSNQNYKNVIEISKKLNIKLIDLNEYLLDNKNNIGRYYPFGGPEGHFSEYGYDSLSKFIIDRIAE